jgi:hypothetical protein
MAKEIAMNGRLLATAAAAMMALSSGMPWSSTAFGAIDDPMAERTPAKDAKKTPKSDASAKKPTRAGAKADDGKAAADSPLAGPRVGAKVTRITLVEFGIDGKVRRPDATPEEAAIGLLNLPPDAAERVTKVVGERARIIERFVTENIDLLTIAGQVFATGKPNEQIMLGVSALEKLMPLWDRGPIRDEIATALPAESRAKFEAILDEYWNAVLDEHRKAKKWGEYSWFGAMAEERLKIVGREIEKAFQRTEQSGGLVYAYVAKDLNLSPQQSRRVRALISEFVEKGGDGAPKEVKDRIFGSVFAMLTPEQAKTLMERFQGKK